MGGQLGLLGHMGPSRVPFKFTVPRKGLPAHLPFGYWLCAQTAFLVAIFDIVYVNVVKL